MAKFCIMVIILIVNFVFQTSILPLIQIVEAKPDTLLILLISLAFVAKNPVSSLFGLVGGVMLDFMYGYTFGLFTGMYLTIGFASGYIFGKIVNNNILMPLLLLLGALLFKAVILTLYIFLTTSAVDLFFLFASVFLPEVIFTVLVSPLLFFGIVKLFNYKFMEKRWRYRG